MSPRHEVVGGIDTRELGRRQRGQRTAMIGRTIQGPVVMHHDHPVARQMYVELEPVGAERQAVLERRDRILRPQRRAATMGEYLGASKTQRSMRPRHR